MRMRTGPNIVACMEVDQVLVRTERGDFTGFEEGDQPSILASHRIEFCPVALNDANASVQHRSQGISKCC